MPHFGILGVTPTNLVLTGLYSLLFPASVYLPVKATAGKKNAVLLWSHFLMLQSQEIKQQFGIAPQPKLLRLRAMNLQSLKWLL